MRKSDLGEFEELVLLAVAISTPLAYTVTIGSEIESEKKYPISMAAVHASLQRLELKGYVNSWLAPSEKTRGGRSKRLYKLTEKGLAILVEVRDTRLRLWSKIKI